MKKHVSLALLGWVAAAPLFAQLGSITGTVKDPSGAVIPGAKVRAVNLATGVAEDVETQANGTYLTPPIAPGNYRVSATATGFKQAEIGGLKVDVNTTLTQDIVMEVGLVTETVKVDGQSTLVETTTGTVGTTVQMSHVMEMPLADRNVFTLVNLVPGAFYRGSEVSIGGGRTRSAAILVDGVTSSRGGLGAQQQDLTPPVDAMQEFKVEVSAMSAELGRTSAGAVNAVTRGGTNQFHGGVYEFLRNNAFDAAGWNADRKPPLRRNNFGGTVGGPIAKNRTFYFYNLDVLLERSGVSTTRSVGLPEWRRGDFASATRDAGGRAAAVPIYDPQTGTGDFGNPRSNTPFPGNVIPASRLDPVAVKAVGYIPAPNRAPNNPFNQAGNWQENRVNPLTRAYHTARLDHDLAASTRLNFRYIGTIPERDYNDYSRGYGIADPDGVRIDNRRQNFVLNGTHLFSPSFFLNATAGFNRVFIRRRSGDCCATNYGREFGIANVPGEAFPRFNVGGGWHRWTTSAPRATPTAWRCSTRSTTPRSSPRPPGRTRFGSGPSTRASRATNSAATSRAGCTASTAASRRASTPTAPPSPTPGCRWPTSCWAGSTRWTRPPSPATAGGSTTTAASSRRTGARRRT
jgi:hypothetical protein